MGGRDQAVLAQQADRLAGRIAGCAVAARQLSLRGHLLPWHEIPALDRLPKLVGNPAAQRPRHLVGSQVTWHAAQPTGGLSQFKDSLLTCRSIPCFTGSSQFWLKPDGDRLNPEGGPRTPHNCIPGARR